MSDTGRVDEAWLDEERVQRASWHLKGSQGASSVRHES